MSPRRPACLSPPPPPSRPTGPEDGIPAIPFGRHLDRNIALGVAANLLGSPDTDDFYLGKGPRALAEVGDKVAPAPRAGAETGPPATWGTPQAREESRQRLRRYRAAAAAARPAGVTGGGAETAYTANTSGETRELPRERHTLEPGSSERHQAATGAVRMAEVAGGGAGTARFALLPAEAGR